MPYQSKRELAISLSAADVHLVPVDSRVYNYLMPSKLYGVLACGTPLVAVTPGESELAQLTSEAQVGLVVPPGDPEALAAVVRWCAAARGPGRHGCSGPRLAENRFDRRRITRQFAELLASTLRVQLPSAERVRVVQENNSPSQTPETVAMNFLQGKRVLVTGGAGFLGRPLCRVLARLNPASIVARE